jgi:hypothetical protein
MASPCDPKSENYDGAESQRRISTPKQKMVPSAAYPDARFFAPTLL